MVRNFFLAKVARPRAPVPKSVMADGSGTEGAVGTMAVLPILVFTFALQKHLVRGLTFGAVK